MLIQLITGLRRSVLVKYTNELNFDLLFMSLKPQLTEVYNLKFRDGRVF